jgi:hypothetical protein
MRWTIIALIVLFAGKSCTQEGFEIKNQTKKSINLPFNLESNSMSLNPANESKLKYVIYIDGDCGSCIEKIFKWKDLPNDSPLYSIPKIYIVGTSNIPRFEFMMEHSNIKFEYFMDSLGLYLQINEIDNPAFHTLLLNKDNNIIAYGDPFAGRKNLLKHEKAIRLSALRRR